MKEFKVLKFIDIFKCVFKKFNVDYESMRKILQLKLTMDARRMPTALGNTKNDEKKDKNNFLSSLWMYLLMSIFLGALVWFNINNMFQMSMFFGIIIFMLVTTMISDFSSVLLDIRDKNILATKPLNVRTISMAKIMHISIYMFYITTSLTGIPLVVVLMKRGVTFFLILIIEIILADLFIIAVTALLYIFILRFFDGEKLKDIINCVQIMLTIFMTVIYQFLGRLFDFVNINVVFTPKWWQYLIPSMWFAGPFELILGGNHKIYVILLSILAILIPCIAIILYIKLIPCYEKNLQKLNNSSSTKNKRSTTQLLSKLFCRNNEERVFFKFICDMMKNEREFKLKAYPSLGMSIIFPFMFMFGSFRNVNSLSQWINEMGSSNYYLNIYFSAISVVNIVYMIKYSKQYKGSWIYKAMPIHKVENVFKGTLKAILLKLIMPVYLVQSVIFIGIFGMRIIPHLIVVFLNIIIFMVVSFKVLGKALPFSQNIKSGQGGAGFESILAMLVLGLLGAIHYGFVIKNFNIYIYLIALIIVNICMWKSCLKIKWSEVV